MPGFEYMGGNSPFNFPVSPLPAGYNTRGMIQLTYEQAVALIWKVKSFRISDGTMYIPPNPDGSPYGDITHSWGDFIATSCTGDTFATWWWHLLSSDQLPLLTPRGDSGLAFLVNSQKFYGISGDSNIAPTPPPSGWPTTTVGFLTDVPVAYAHSLVFEWGPFQGTQNNPETDPARGMQYDRENDCFWVQPPLLKFSHGMIIYWTFDGSNVWLLYANAVSATTKNGPVEIAPYYHEAGTATLNLWGQSHEIPIKIQAGSYVSVGTDGAGAGVTASATIEVHEEWDY